MSKKDLSQSELFSELVSSQVLEQDDVTAKASTAERRTRAFQSSVRKQKAPTVISIKDLRAPSSQLLERYFSDKEVAAHFGVSRPTVWRWVRAYPEFPQPVEVTPGTTRWLLSELEAHATRLKRKRAAK